MKVLITGISGFVGSHLAEYYLSQGTREIYGLIRRRSSLENIEHIKDCLILKEGDLIYPYSIENLIREIQPDIIHHLAAQSFVPTSWKQPSETFQTNIFGALNLFEAVRKFSPKTIVQVASTSEVYGNVKSPITEETVPEPASPYGVSKLAMDRLASQYVKSYGLKIVITRAFNHTGPRRHQNFATSSFAYQIASQPQIGSIRVGNLLAQRDWSDVRDIVCAYALSISKCPYGTPFNIASGRAYSIREVLDLLIEISGKKIEIIQDSVLIRPSDVQGLIGDSTKFRTLTGWKNSIPFEKTLEDLYRYWEKKLGKTF